jgi:hypothetical protein
MLINVQFSIKISRLSEQVKNLVQKNALLRHDLEAGRRTPSRIVPLEVTPAATPRNIGRLP